MSLEKTVSLPPRRPKEMVNWVNLLSILIVSLSVSSCISSDNKAPVHSRQQPPSTKLFTHVVAPTETLYAIAWRYGLDYKSLARINNIGASNTIFPGQILYLHDQEPVVTSRYQRRRSSEKTSTLTSKVSPPVRPQIKTKKRPNTSTYSPENKTGSNQSSVKSSGPEPLSSTFYSNNQKINWRWPAVGKVLANFYSRKDLKKGIDIAGKKGDAVLAAASGKVVYAGSGLRNYGKLVIIKHSEVYLSAYAHNHRLRVKEGDIVKAGQHIADVGASGTGANGKPKLHFQIRLDGKPIDPLPLLPKRKV